MCLWWRWQGDGCSCFAPAHVVARPHWRPLGIGSNLIFLQEEEESFSLCVHVYVRACVIEKEAERENGHIYLCTHLIEYFYAHMHALI